MKLNNQSIILWQNEADAFMRIAQAQLKSKYIFGPQRRAIAAKMLMRWIERKTNPIESVPNDENFCGVVDIIQ
jgi:hypothetical protein